MYGVYAKSVFVANSVLASVKAAGFRQHGFICC